MENKLVRLIRILTMTPDINEALNEFLRELGQHYAADRAYIVEYDLPQGTFTNTFEWCAPGIASEMELLKGLSMSILDDWNRRFMEQGEFFITSLKDDLDESSRDRELLEMQEVESLLAAPLKIGNVIVGMLGVDNPRGHDDTKLLCATADFIVVELEKRRMLERLEQITYFDELTGVRNRNSYMHQIEMMKNETLDSLGTFNLDINGLNKLNELFGYDYGDKVLKNVARTLEKLCPGDIFRIGEDEFVVMLRNVSSDEFHRICDRVRNAFSCKDEYTVSIGSSWVSGDSASDLEGIFAKIYELMYVEKASYYYDQDYGQGMIKHGSVTAELLQEIEEGRFKVFFQPQVDIETGRIVSAEALVRKFDENGKMISPMQFVPRYEALGIQMYLDRFVLKSVIQMLVKMPREKRPTSVSVNISRPMIERPHFVDEVKELLDKYGLEPQYLVLEITESVAKIGYDLLKRIVEELKECGVSVALDDFGTEYSNLAVITNIGFDEIKLDKSLIDNICTDDRSRIVLSSIIDMCCKLGNVRIMAEGVEHHEQSEKLRELNCRYGQGYLFYRPMPMEAFLELMEK